MICPHCGVGTSPNFRTNLLGKDGGAHMYSKAGNCTECERLIVLATVSMVMPNAQGFPEERVLEELPMFPARPLSRRAPEHVPADYAADFEQAAIVLADSPKASAALSRRLLQHVLREQGGFKARDLEKEIQAAIDSNTLPPDLAHDLDALRTVGNFAAHPIKSTNTGEVVDVEPNEAEWVLDLVDELLQHYFTRPAIREKRRAALNAKLKDAGKPDLKGTPEAPKDAQPPPTVGSS